jgi:hypothetical protein
VEAIIIDAYVSVAPARLRALVDRV